MHDAAPEITGHLDEPAVGSPPTDEFLTVGGWAWARRGVKSIQILIDGRPSGVPEHNLPRPDVAAARPELEGAAASGYRAVVDVGNLSHGAHSLSVVVTDEAEGTLLLDREFSVARRAKGSHLPASDLLPRISTESDYWAALKDFDSWLPALGQVCSWEGLNAARLGSVGASTYPAAAVGTECVIKLFGPWLAGGRAAANERLAYGLLQAQPLPVPSMVSHGQLDGRWSYVIVTFLEGVPFHSVRDRLEPSSEAAFASWLGKFVRRLHSVPVPDETVEVGARTFREFMSAQRRNLVAHLRARKSLAPHLIDQLDSWLPALDEIVPADSTMVLLHGDLHDENVFGNTSVGVYTPTGVIDFTSARIGHPLYELAPVWRWALRCRADLLELFLAEAGIATGDVKLFARNALAYLLLHDGDQVSDMPGADSAADLDELAALTFGTPTVG